MLIIQIHLWRKLLQELKAIDEDRVTTVKNYLRKRAAATMGFLRVVHSIFDEVVEIL